MKITKFAENIRSYLNPSKQLSDHRWTEENFLTLAKACGPLTNVVTNGEAQIHVNEAAAILGQNSFSYYSQGLKLDHHT